MENTQDKCYLNKICGKKSTLDDTRLCDGEFGDFYLGCDNLQLFWNVMEKCGYDIRIENKVISTMHN